MRPLNCLKCFNMPSLEYAICLLEKRSSKGQHCKGQYECTADFQQKGSLRCTSQSSSYLDTEPLSLTDIADAADSACTADLNGLSMLSQDPDEGCPRLRLLHVLQMPTQGGLTTSSAMVRFCRFCRDLVLLCASYALTQIIAHVHVQTQLLTGSLRSLQGPLTCSVLPHLLF